MFDLPMADKLVNRLSQEQTGPYPEDARPIPSLCSGMIKQSSGFHRTLFQSERIVHDQNDVNVIRVRFVRYIAPKHNQSQKMISSLRQNQDVKQTSGDQSALLCALTKALDKNLNRNAMYALRQITEFVTGRNIIGLSCCPLSTTSPTPTLWAQPSVPDVTPGDARPPPETPRLGVTLSGLTVGTMTQASATWAV